MFGAYLAAWRRLPQPMQQQLLRDRLSVLLTISDSDLSLVRNLLPASARQPFSDLLIALRAWN